MATLSLAVWSMVTFFNQVDLDNLQAQCAGKTPVRHFSGYLTAISLLFMLAWLKQIIPAMFDSAAPTFLAGTIMLTSPEEGLA
jgi:hypothetical protein